ncbi:MAG: hypothetical protein LBI03_02945 [Clostridiales bacterium]|nr:hypothetical protein [Clostridiales bacterium]
MYKDWCGKPCGKCQTSCAVDESIPCSPDCELLDEDGTIKDYKKCLENGCDTLLFEELYLDKETVNRWQRLVNMSEVDFDRDGIDPDCVLEAWSVEFDNGYFAELKVCSGEDNLFLDAVLFEPWNDALRQAFVLDCPDNILGDHVFQPYERSNVYVMRISLKTE